MFFGYYKTMRDKEVSKIADIINELDLSPLQKNILMNRYTQVIYNLYNRANTYSKIYHSGHFIITVGSLFVPALLSIQYSNTIMNESYQQNIFWSTWIISLLVTIFNGILTLYRVDKKYFLLNTVLERLKSEGWQYFGLTGRYSGHLINHSIPTHTNQFIYFCYAIEKISMKLVAEEFFKNGEKHQSPSNPAILEQGRNNYSVSNEMYVPSPDINLVSSKEAGKVVSSIIRSTKTIGHLSPKNYKSNINYDLDIENKKQTASKENNSKDDKSKQDYAKEEDLIDIDNLSNYTFESKSDDNEDKISINYSENSTVDTTKTNNTKTSKTSKTIENEIIIVSK